MTLVLQRMIGGLPLLFLLAANIKVPAENGGRRVAALRSAGSELRSQVAAPKLSTTNAVKPTKPSFPVMEAYKRLPLVFEPNIGQTSSQVRFIARADGYTLFLTESAAVLATREGVARMKLLGAGKARSFEGLEATGGISNYFLGNDHTQWRTRINHYTRVRQKEAYPGIDVVWYGSRGRLEYDFVVAPAADPTVIEVGWDGVETLEAQENGELLMRLIGGGELRLEPPTVYQEVNHSRIAVSCRYRVREKRRVSFELARYDTTRPLIIDPVLVYSTYLGGGDDEAVGIAVDAAGNAYITGWTGSTSFPVTSGAYDNSYNGNRDVFVTKLNAAGTALIYSTFLGGSQEEGTGSSLVGDPQGGIAVDVSGDVYVTSRTISQDFPTTPGAYDVTYNGGLYDAFVTKLNPTGTAMLFSTYLGGSGSEVVGRIAVDTGDNVHVVGGTNSSDFPTTPGAFDSSYNGQFDVFVAKLNGAGTTLMYSTFLGGMRDDSARGIATDSGGNAYVTGSTFSADFPTTPAAFDTSFNAGGLFDDDVFVVKLSATNSSLSYSTFVGAAGDDNGEGIALDSAGNAYITGSTSSRNFPTTAGAYDVTYNGGLYDAFVAKVNATGSTLVYSTLLGGGDTDGGRGIAVDLAGNAFLIGNTNSADFPVSRDAPELTYEGSRDAFVAKLNPAGSALVFSSFLGGREFESGSAIALDGVGNAHLAGRTQSAADFVATPGAFQNAARGRVSAFVVKLGEPLLSSVSAASFIAGAVATESIVSAFGMGLAESSESATAVPLPTSLAGISLQVRDGSGTQRLAPLFHVGPNQINFLIPAASRAGVATISVIRQGQVVAEGTVQIDAVAPGLFSANADGRGVAAALAVRIDASGQQTPVSVFQCGSAPGSCFSTPIDLGEETDQVIVLLFGTGIRGRSELSSVSVRAGATETPVLYAGPQGDFMGLDQVNVRLPRSLRGSGEVDLVLRVEGRGANSLRISVR